MATVVHNLNVSGNKKKTVDVGEVTVQLHSAIGVGDAAPGFEVTTLKDETVRLQDLRGKVVLVHFGAAWCGDSIAQVPALKAVHDACGKDERFAMIGLSLDPTVEALTRFVEQQDIGWPQAHLGDWSQTTLPSQFAVSYIPTTCLIGPDGTIVALGFRGRQVLEEVEEALAGMK